MTIPVLEKKQKKRKKNEKQKIASSMQKKNRLEK